MRDRNEKDPRPPTGREVADGSLGVGRGSPSRRVKLPPGQLV
jgi:hypothetical protein